MFKHKEENIARNRRSEILQEQRRGQMVYAHDGEMNYLEAAGGVRSRAAH